MITKVITLTNLDNLLNLSNGTKGETLFNLTRFVFNNILLLNEFKQDNFLTGHFTFVEVTSVWIRTQTLVTSYFP